jgi:methyl-accepting chemotaxis protein
LADRDLPAIQEKFLAKSAVLVFAILVDRNGYVPTHNRQYSQPLTGNRAVDLVSNRTKRIFGDPTGFNAARSEAPFLLQAYKRDTGEVFADMSVPVRVHGKHWGGVRMGYRRVEK